MLKNDTIKKMKWFEIRFQKDLQVKAKDKNEAIEKASELLWDGMLHYSGLAGLEKKVLKAKQ